MFLLIGIIGIIQAEKTPEVAGESAADCCCCVKKGCDTVRRARRAQRCAYKAAVLDSASCNSSLLVEGERKVEV